MLLTFLFLRLVIVIFSHLCEAGVTAEQTEWRPLRPDGSHQLAPLLRHRETPEAPGRGARDGC